MATKYDLLETRSIKVKLKFDHLILLFFDLCFSLYKN